MRLRRKHKRIVKRLETEFSAGGLNSRGISSDLSESGLFVRTSKPFSPDTMLDLTIHLPGKMAARLKGRVRWAAKVGQLSGRNGMGIEIIERDETFVTFLNTLLPPGERIKHKENSNAGPVSKDAQDQPVVPPESEQKPKDELDSMISSLFSKRDGK